MFINALPMPGYVRGSASLRGRDALTSAPKFSATKLRPAYLDEDYRMRGMGSTSESETDGAFAGSFGPFLDSDPPLLPEFVDADEFTSFPKESANKIAQPFTEIRIVILLLVGFIAGLMCTMQIKIDLFPQSFLNYFLDVCTAGLAIH